MLDRLNFTYAKVIGKKLTDILGEGQSKNLEIDYRGSEFSWLGHVYDITVSPTPGEGASKNVICALHDITELKKMEQKFAEESNLLRALIDNLPDRIYVKDTQGRKTISNQADMLASGAKTMQAIIGKSDL